MRRTHRPISWIKAARKDFDRFPKGAKDNILDALSAAAEGRKASIAKPLKGFGSGVLEIALKFRTDAYRTIYAVQLDEAIWVLHAFQKKSSSGIKTPKTEIDVAKDRLKRLKEMLA